MQIRNTTKKLLTIPATKQGRQKVNIPPGVSEIPFANVGELVRFGGRTVERWLDAGYLAPAYAREVPAPAPIAPPPPQTSSGTGGEELGDLSTFTADEAKELIDQETDPAVLSAWLEAEKRKGVKALLEVRLAGLSQA